MRKPAKRRGIASWLLKCKVCGRETLEYLVTHYKKRFLFITHEGEKDVPLCRQHLLERFREEFTSGAEKMVVLYPNLEEKSDAYEYVFLSREDLEKGYWPDNPHGFELPGFVEKNLGKIHGRCQKCERDASIAYFGREHLRWSRPMGVLGESADMPMVHEIQAEPQLLCPPCAFGAIEASFQYATKGFGHGVCSPHEGKEGLLMTVEIF